MRTKIYEVYGCIGDAEIFIGSSDLIQIATVTANNKKPPVKAARRII